MVYLTLKLEDRHLKTFHFADNQKITIGRKNDNLVAIDHNAVSAHHAKIKFRDGRYLLTDLHSKNGCFVNEEFVNSHWLSDGDIITIGKHTLIFECTADPAQLELNIQNGERTVLLDSEEHREMRAKSFLKRALGNSGVSRKLVLAYLRGGEGEMRLTNKMTTIGKSPNADIRISGLLVGQTAATISKRPTGYFLSYTGGLARPRVNGKKVSSSVLLKADDIIRIGSATWQVLME